MTKESKQHTQQKGYRAPLHTSDPSAFAQVDAPPQTLHDAAHKEQRPTLSHKKAAGIVLIVIAAVACIWLVAWLNRSVTFTLNGQVATAKAGTSIQTVIDERHVKVSPGNFVSVTGAVLEAGMGDAFSLAVNGEQLDYAQAKSYIIQDPAELVVSNGGDVMENYETTYTDCVPQLEQHGLQGALTYVSQWPEAGSQEVRHGAISDEYALGDIVQEPKNCVLTTGDVHPANDEKLVALTFNELSASATQSALSTLEAADAHGTFFMTGDACTQNASVAAAIVQAHSQLASLSERFEALPPLGESALRETLAQGFTAANKASGAATSALRPPYGQFDLQTWLHSGGLMSTCVFWNAEAGTASSVDAVVSATCTNVQPGSIILAADGGANMQVELAALPKIIKQLQDAGYKLVTLSELMQADPNIGSAAASCSATLGEGGVWPTELAKNVDGG